MAHEHQPAENERQHIWDSPKNVQKLLIVFWIGCAIIFGFDFFIDRYLSFKDDQFPIEGWLGFYGIYG